MTGKLEHSGNHEHQKKNKRCELKPDRKRKNLIRLGIKQGQAYAWSRTRMGGWSVAQSPILNTTITVKRLKLKGYISLKEYYLKVKSN